MEITYIDRRSGEKCVEKVYGHKALSLLYGDGFFRRLFSMAVLPIIAHVPLFSHFYGFLQKRAASAKKIAPFIQAYGIDESEFVETHFSSFNDFFIRKLKAEKRPINSDPSVLSMPADGRYLVYPQFGQFVVKGQEFSIQQFLGNISLASHFSEGSMAIVRLCPTDYHRFHFPCDGVPSQARLINGPLYSVNPIALKRRLAILAENKRMITEIETKEFGTILYVEIGATSVGSIQQTYTSEFPVKKGDEKGFFEFGGSCIALLFEKNRVVFDADLIANTQNGLETRANFGESFARKAP
ncbi:MAG: phosphatidylserine decarboxylase [Chlamydiae bacterium CG10_big_fil_rev_8_21_14_0_10_42_34]|nr:MAG: phosphatidylserine decarboxylase [Chlamydiae bacterium CG10_big_fil_rev_8_21_14_0_10_42_34]